MARRLILDTGVLIQTERSGELLAAVFAADDDVAIAAITVAELQTGVELASPERHPARALLVEAALEAFPIEDYDRLVASEHARLLAHVHRSGTPRGAHDLIIAATAVATKRTIITMDRTARFSELPGVVCQVISTA